MFRKSLFWLHLVCGILSGIIIAILCGTGAILAFEKEILAWVDRDQLKVDVSSEATRLSIDKLYAAARSAEPDTTFSSIETQADPTSAWKLVVGRGDFRYIDPYSGEIEEPASKSWKPFFSFNLRLHRWLVQSGDSRAIGKHITGAANLIFILLGVTGLYLWFPRAFVWRLFKNGLLFSKNAKGKNRDFNWHNVFGFWALIPILIMAITGSVFSYGWSRDLANKLLGPSLSRAPLQTDQEVSRRGRPLSLEDRYASVQNWSNDWSSITLPLGSGRGRRGGQGTANTGGQSGNQGEQAVQRGHQHGSHNHGASDQGTVAGGNRGSHGHSHNHGGGGQGGGSRGGGRGNSGTISIKEEGEWFPLSPARILMNPRNGEILASSNPKEWTFTQKIRASIRGIHTGEAGLLPGKIIAFLGCAAGLMLVYTGFALSWRRFFGNKPKAKTQAEPEKEAETLVTAN